MKIYNFDLLAYPDIPADAPGTPIPSTYFDPSIGALNYRQHLDEMAYCEALGFEGVQRYVLQLFQTRQSRTGQFPSTELG